MIVNVIEIFTEYLSIILCLHKVANKKIIIDKYVIAFGLLNMLSVFVSHRYYQECSWLMLIMYINFIVYVRLRLAQTWRDIVKIFGLMLIIIPSLQLICFFFIKFIFNVFSITINELLMGILANCIICILVICWKEEYIFKFAREIIKSRGLILLLLFCIYLFYILYTYNQLNFIHKSMTVQALIGIIGAGGISALWVNAENEKRNKAKEIQLYKLYNKTFEEAIATIRSRQHEFDNHINAIKCLQLTIENPNELAKAQKEYCEKVLADNSFNNLLKLHTEPILTGFLYSKFMSARKQGICVVHEVHAIELKENVEINELIEIIGILWDNAIEALLDLDDVNKIVIVKIIKEGDRKISVEIANKSYKYLNSDIEKFCKRGYSTKGEGRGIGLFRVKKIVCKYKADFHIQNIDYNGENYLSFKIIFNN